MHVQTNACVDSSETSTKLLECRLDLLSLVWTLSHADSPLCSGVWCRLLLSVVPRQLLSSSSFFVSLSSRVPLSLPVTLRSRVQNPLSGFAPKQRNRLLGGPPTYCYTGDSLHLRDGLSGAGERLRRLFSIRQPPQRWGFSAS